MPPDAKKTSISKLDRLSEELHLFNLVFSHRFLSVIAEISFLNKLITGKLKPQTVNLNRKLALRGIRDVTLPRYLPPPLPHQPKLYGLCGPL